MELVPGRKYRFWVHGKPLDYVVTFERVILMQKRPTLPRLELYPPLPVDDVAFEFRRDDGFQIFVSASDLKGMALEVIN